MLRSELDVLLDSALAGRRLLSHPFYRRWEAGKLAREELGSYASQYRHFEAAVPEILEEIAERLEDAAALESVGANLSDERGVPAPHLEIFDEFATCVGGRRDAEATPATKALVSAYHRFAKQDPAAGLAAFAAYEVQAPQIARSKADGLRRHYGLDALGTRFWDVHGEMDEAHCAWTLDALAAVAPDPAVARSAARIAADRWWSFLDERESLAASLAVC